MTLSSSNVSVRLLYYIANYLCIISFDLLGSLCLLVADTRRSAAFFLLATAVFLTWLLLFSIGKFTCTEHLRALLLRSSKLKLFSGKSTCYTAQVDMPKGLLQYDNLSLGILA